MRGITEKSKQKGSRVTLGVTSTLSRCVFFFFLGSLPQADDCRYIWAYVLYH